MLYWKLENADSIMTQGELVVDYSFEDTYFCFYCLRIISGSDGEKAMYL